MPPQPLPPTRDGREWPLIFPFPKPIDFELYSKFLSFYCHYISLSHSDIRHTPLFSLPDFTNLIIFQTFLYPVLKLFKIFNTGYGPISRLDFVKSFTEHRNTIPVGVGVPVGMGIIPFCMVLFPFLWQIYFCSIRTGFLLDSHSQRKSQFRGVDYTDLPTSTPVWCSGVTDTCSSVDQRTD